MVIVIIACLKNKLLPLTKKACQQFSRIAQKSNNQHIPFYVKGGGCNGFNYKLEPTSDPPEKKNEIIQRDNYVLSVCNMSLIHLLGTEIDWKKDIMGESFHFNNPMAKSKCGCGTSFSSKGI